MNDTVLAQLADLEDLDRKGLLERWRLLFGKEPPGYSTAMMRSRLAYRVQELAFGGLSELTRAALHQALPEGEGGDRKLRRRRPVDGMPVAGTRLVREYQGRTYDVVVTDQGFELEGRPYRSLSAVARAITGTRWNGWAFFGIKRQVGGKGAR
ncbi:MAG: DUF2924 domain-containing protein [Planctomycetes bacterium]|nr:DUF2924 domain-containing protein [Planctomycetota bacterium]